MIKLKDRHPSYELVRWVNENDIGLRHALDRPWFEAPPPDEVVGTWVYLCRCNRAAVEVTGYGREDGEGILYLGQCPRCETILWSFLPREAGTRRRR
jgi:hypothetical protein